MKRILRFPLSNSPLMENTFWQPPSTSKRVCVMGQFMVGYVYNILIGTTVPPNSNPQFFKLLELYSIKVKYESEV